MDQAVGLVVLMRSRARRHGGARRRGEMVGRDDEAFRLVWFGREGCRWVGLGMGNWRIACGLRSQCSPFYGVAELVEKGYCEVEAGA